MQPFFKSLRMVTQGILLLKLVPLEGREATGEGTSERESSQGSTDRKTAAKTGGDHESFLPHRRIKVSEL